MSRVEIDLTVPVEASWPADATIEVFSDRGGGSIDYTNPLLRRRLNTLRNVVAPQGIGADPIGALPIGHGKAAAVRNVRGLGALPIGAGPIGADLETVEVAVEVGQGCGTYKFAARAVDGAGNKQSGAGNEFEHWVSGEDPPHLEALAVESYHAGNDQFTFSVVG